MYLIAHRGNIEGRNPEQENSPLYITRALERGYDVELDVWYIGGKWYLGHDKPLYLINRDFLLQNWLWCHAKNVQALVRMLKVKEIHCFWHVVDKCVLTSCGYIWALPHCEMTPLSVCVFGEDLKPFIPISCAGICSDYVGTLKCVK